MQLLAPRLKGRQAGKRCGETCHSPPPPSRPPLVDRCLAAWWRNYSRVSRACALQNPFGSAKPRESVLATRSGRSEQEILAEEVKKQGLNVRASRASLRMAA